MQLRGVGLRASGKTLLKNLTFDLPMGGLVFLRGENGSGKTSLLRLLAAQLPAFGGEGRVCGYDLRDREALRRLSHLMPVEGGFYADLSAEENLIFFLRLHDQPTEDIGATLRRVGLERAATRPVRLFSAGMKKRLALARASLMRTPLLLLDEPSANLDEAGKCLVAELIGELCSPDRTLVIAAHDSELLAAHPSALQLQLHDRTAKL